MYVVGFAFMGGPWPLQFSGAKILMWKEIEFLMVEIALCSNTCCLLRVLKPCTRSAAQWCGVKGYWEMVKALNLCCGMSSGAWLKFPVLSSADHVRGQEPTLPRSFALSNAPHSVSLSVWTGHSGHKWSSGVKRWRPHLRRYALHR